MRVGHVIVGAVALLVGGCTVLGSETFDQLKADGRAPRGVQYALPRGTVKATLTVDPATLGFTLSLEQGDMVPDPDHEYVLRYRSHPSYEDDIEIKTNDRGLLTKVYSTTTDKTPEIIVNIAKALSFAGGLESDVAATQKLYERPFDPLIDEQRNAVIADINRVVVSHIASARESCALAGAKGSEAAKALKKVNDQLEDVDGEVKSSTEAKSVVDAAVKGALEAVTKKAAEKLEKSQVNCDSPTEPVVIRACQLIELQRDTNAKQSKALEKKNKLEAAKSTLEAQQNPREELCDALDGLIASPPKATISLPDFSVDDPQFVSASFVPPQGEPPAADCSIGICYRPPVPVTIKYSLGAGASSVVVDLPNPSAIVAIDIRRAFLIKKVQQMDFDQGMLLKLHIEKQSELVAIAKLPVDVISAIGEGIQLRADVTTSHKNELEKQAALLQAQADLVQARAQATGSARPGVEAASVVRRGRRGATSAPVVP